MKKLLIIKTGITLREIKKNYGDFEDFFVNAMGSDSQCVTVLPAYESLRFPEEKKLSGIIITGSHSMVTNYEPWSVEVSKWLRGLENSSIPILGICYGHQLIADAFGGKVDYDPRGKEVGTVLVHLTEEGKKDPLLGVLPENFPAHSFHSQRVVELPEKAVLLAENAYESHHSFRIGEHIWGVQFHPEFSRDIMKAYINGFESDLTNEGHSTEELKATLKEHSFGRILLKRFYELTR